MVRATRSRRSPRPPHRERGSSRPRSRTRRLCGGACKSPPNARHAQGVRRGAAPELIWTPLPRSHSKASARRSTPANPASPVHRSVSATGKLPRERFVTRTERRNCRQVRQSVAPRHKRSEGVQPHRDGRWRQCPVVEFRHRIVPKIPLRGDCRAVLVVRRSDEHRRGTATRRAGREAQAESGHRLGPTRVVVDHAIVQATVRAQLDEPCAKSPQRHPR